MTMQTQIHYRLRLAHDIRDEQIRAAANARLAAALRRRAAPRPAIRRTLGALIIAIGTRLAADPSIEPARSR
jgi:hypothetical protein